MRIQYTHLLYTLPWSHTRSLCLLIHWIYQLDWLLGATVRWMLTLGQMKGALPRSSCCGRNAPWKVRYRSQLPPRWPFKGYFTGPCFQAHVQCKHYIRLHATVKSNSLHTADSQIRDTVQPEAAVVPPDLLSDAFKTSGLFLKWGFMRRMTWSGPLCSIINSRFNHPQNSFSHSSCVRAGSAVSADFFALTTPVFTMVHGLKTPSSTQLSSSALLIK